MGVDGIDKLRARLPTAKQITVETERTIGSAALIIQANIQRVAPVDTGNLRRRIFQTENKTGATVFTRVFYAPFVKGTASVARKIAKGKRKRQSRSGGKRYPPPPTPPDFWLVGVERGLSQLRRTAPKNSR